MLYDKFITGRINVFTPLPDLIYLSIDLLPTLILMVSLQNKMINQLEGYLNYSV